MKVLVHPGHVEVEQVEQVDLLYKEVKLKLLFVEVQGRALASPVHSPVD